MRPSYAWKSLCLGDTTCEQWDSARLVACNSRTAAKPSVLYLGSATRSSEKGLYYTEASILINSALGTSNTVINHISLVVVMCVPAPRCLSSHVAEPLNAPPTPDWPERMLASVDATSRETQVSLRKSRRRHKLLRVLHRTDPYSIPECCLLSFSLYHHPLLFCVGCAHLFPKLTVTRLCNSTVAMLKGSPPTPPVFWGAAGGGGGATVVWLPVLP
jgi:hypothetical protein